ncbi:MAG: HAMP domain-containing sensor histidine kinase [Gemmatimonadales bacterium]|nr:HAMP domain-containing sensor histidine kinase [Gemmatimonadales bacterium]
MARAGGRRVAPALVVVLVALLVLLNAGSFLLMARHLRRDATLTSRLYSGVFVGLNNPRPGAEVDALVSLGEQLRELGIPVVVTGPDGRVTAAANIPFSAALDDPRLADFARRLDVANSPIADSAVGTVHYGQLPAERQISVLAALQVLTLLVVAAVAAFAYRSAVSARRDRLWVAMAREAAHQLGTPLMSLQGWIEHLKGRVTPVPELADHLEADAERLERVARRFERIGNPARREPVGLGALAERVGGYFRPRLPRRANPITLVVEAEGPGPTVTGDPVLLEWALEALVKNAIDALQGRAGTITLRVGTEAGMAVVRVLDDGPGVPRELRRTLFEPGISSKPGGWGIGLALVQRVAVEAHRGEVELEPVERGSSFLLRLPMAEGA